MDGEILNFVLSCRVIGLGGERVLLDAVIADARADGRTLNGRIIRTDRNIPVRLLYPDHGFTEREPNFWTMILPREANEPVLERERMPETISLPMRAGDRPPRSYGISPDRVFYSFEEQYGRPAVLILAGANSGLLPAVAAGLVPHLGSFAARNADVLILVADNPAHLLGGKLPLMPIRTIDCGNFLSRCGVGPCDTLVLVVDRNLRIAMRLAPDQGADVAVDCLACLDALPSEPRRVDARADHPAAEPAAARALPPSHRPL